MMFSLTHKFHLSDVLSVLTRRMLSRGNGLYEIAEYVTGDSRISTAGLAMQSDRIEEEILRQHPQLKDVDVDFPKIPETATNSERQELVSGWLAAQIAKFGETLPIKPAEIPIALDGNEEADFVRSLNPNIKGIDVPVDEDDGEIGWPAFRP